MKTYKQMALEIQGLSEGDVWYPVRTEKELKVDDYVRTPDGLVRVVNLISGEGNFWGEIITAIHKDVIAGETYSYSIRDIQVLAKKKNKNKISVSDLMSIDDISIGHKSPDLYNPITINPIIEKSLSTDEVRDLLDKAQSSAEGIKKDKERDKDDRKTAGEVIKWIKDVRKSYNRDGKLHPSIIVSLMKTVTGVQSGRYGYMTPGWKKSPQGKVPQDFRKEVTEGLTASITRGLALVLKRRAIAAGSRVRKLEDLDQKIDALSKQISVIAGLALLATSVSGDGILSKASIVSGLLSHYEIEKGQMI